MRPARSWQEEKRRCRCRLLAKGRAAARKASGDTSYVILAGDFPFTGGGLGAFSGLYSTYILVIFVPLFTYSHNFFLDVAVEQGWFGLAALVVMLVGSAGLSAEIVHLIIK